jgi:hypothetical protein
MLVDVIVASSTVVEAGTSSVKVLERISVVELVSVEVKSGVQSEPSAQGSPPKTHSDPSEEVWATMISKTRARARK